MAGMARAAFSPCSRRLEHATRQTKFEGVRGVEIASLCSQ